MSGRMGSRRISLFFVPLAGSPRTTISRRVPVDVGPGHPCGFAESPEAGVGQELDQFGNPRSPSAASRSDLIDERPKLIRFGQDQVLLLHPDAWDSRGRVLEWLQAKGLVFPDGHIEDLAQGADGVVEVVAAEAQFGGPLPALVRR